MRLLPLVVVLAACNAKPGFGKYWVSVQAGSHECTFDGNDQDLGAWAMAQTIADGQAEVDNTEAGNMAWGQVDALEQQMTCTTTPGDMLCERTFTHDYNSGVAWGDAMHTSVMTVEGEWVKWGHITDELLASRVQACDTGERSQCGAFIADLVLTAECTGPDCDRVNERSPTMDFPCTSTATVQGIQVPNDFFP